MMNEMKRETDGLIFTFSGDITLSTIEKANGIFHCDDNFESLKYSIWDFMNGNFDQIALEDMIHIVAADIGASFTLRNAHKTAIITKDPYTTKACNYYIEQCSKYDFPWITCIFSSFEEAKAWTSKQLRSEDTNL